MSACPHCGAAQPPGATHCAGCGLALGAGPTPRGASKPLIVAVVGCGCLVVGLVAAGIVAAIAIPALVDAQTRAKRHRTITEMRAIAATLEAHRGQAGTYPPAGGADVLAILAPPEDERRPDDQWLQDLRYSCLRPIDGGCASYELATPGRDGVFEHQPGEYERGTFPHTAVDSDIVLSDGLLVRWPEGHSEGTPEDSGP
jgi:hypothetical protein